MIKKIVPILIIISLVSPSFVEIAQADVLNSTVTFGSCAGAGFLSNYMKEGLIRLENWVKNKLTGWLGRKLETGYNTVPTTDKPTTDSVNLFKGLYGAKESIEDIVARCAAREILTAMGRNINNVARTAGRNGGPAWVRNWRNFQLDAQYRGEGIFKGMLASTNLCNYFGGELKNLFGANEKISLTKIQTRVGDLDSFALKSGCTLPKDFDFEKYKQDFSGNGGWEAWSRLLQSQNNYYGALFQSIEEADKQRSLEESTDINEAAQSGLTSSRGRGDTCSVKSRNGRCLIYKDIVTPGGILSGAVVAGIESELQWVATSDELNEIIASAINVLANRLFDLSNPDEGDYIVPGDPEASISPFPSPTTPTGCQVSVVYPEDGAEERYGADVKSAVQEFLDANPDVADASKQDQANVDQYLEGVADILKSKGYISGRVVNCNNNVSKGSIIVAQPGDIYGDYEDMVLSQEDGIDASIRERAQPIFQEWAGIERLVGGNQ